MLDSGIESDDYEEFRQKKVGVHPTKAAFS
jgi:hypothetical protein